MPGQGILLLWDGHCQPFFPSSPLRRTKFVPFSLFFSFFLPFFLHPAPLATFPGFSAANNWFTSLTLAKVSHAMT